ncbi:NAD(P)-binding protein [Aspergillus affinis]|uniref:NAD(P)-binding protein n=1 Tax=Aspergillus affinis TaxID=1070780 RepID=UPI0022FE835A|nr:NAD(P)-binding protein [Aspergillus affinis]KAI9044485.1 NAD(P)-binding protein [Aspergillus affinis]
MASSFVAIAGATGILGQQVAKNLTRRGVPVKALVRPRTDHARTQSLHDRKVSIVPVNFSDVAALTRELNGATCVVSTLQGLRDVIYNVQTNLLDAAVAAKVPRFIPSDFSLDFTKTTPGSNRNLDLRREFHAQLERSGIVWTSILNGGFMDLLGGDSPMINHKKGKVVYVGKATQSLDLTTIQDTAAYTAAVAADPNPTPRFLRIAGDVVSVQDIAAALEALEGKQYQPSWMGSVGFLEVMIRVLRAFGGENDIFPSWQRMQYMANMFSGVAKLEPLDNDRYPGLQWTRVADYLREDRMRRLSK